MKEKRKERKSACRCNVNTCTGGGYCLGFIGAAVYNISTATTFGMGFWGFLKAIVWPAFLVFELMKFLGM
ncbi:hypothetical protein CMI38_01790 [Candidatus Pacearchaeota archaeon]|jgi:hypothetical protein|nr:hypothetical protein [Candidatus Pacearchaeota archaeon]|tara:strand:+ start:408 stop:617 length:210 start_codon:yes stop_codon:yes gene_type:complete